MIFKVVSWTHYSTCCLVIKNIKLIVVCTLQGQGKHITRFSTIHQLGSYSDSFLHSYSFLFIPYLVTANACTNTFRVSDHSDLSPNHVLIWSRDMQNDAIPWAPFSSENRCPPDPSDPSCLCMFAVTTQDTTKTEYECKYEFGYDRLIDVVHVLPWVCPHPAYCTLIDCSSLLNSLPVFQGTRIHWGCGHWTIHT